jgi:hypothetical protein
MLACATEHEQEPNEKKNGLIIDWIGNWIELDSHSIGIGFALDSHWIIKDSYKVY